MGYPPRVSFQVHPQIIVEYGALQAEVHVFKVPAGREDDPEAEMIHWQVFHGHEYGTDLLPHFLTALQTDLVAASRIIQSVDLCAGTLAARADVGTLPGEHQDLLLHAVRADEFLRDTMLSFFAEKVRGCQ